MTYGRKVPLPVKRMSSFSADTVMFWMSPVVFTISRSSLSANFSIEIKLSIVSGKMAVCPESP